MPDRFGGQARGLLHYIAEMFFPLSALGHNFHAMLWHRLSLEDIQKFGVSDIVLYRTQ